MKQLENIGNALLGLSLISCFIFTVMFIWFGDLVFGKIALIEFITAIFIIVMYGVFIYKPKDD